MKTLQAYRFALDLTPAQERMVVAHAGGARFAYNWTLAAVKANLDQRAAERSYGLHEDQLTPALDWSLPAMRRRWNAAKRQVAPWWAELSKEAYNTGLDALARALKAWRSSQIGERAGRRINFPQFKSRHRTTPVVRFWTGSIRIEQDQRHVVLPRLGRMKLHENARKLARRLHAGTARILSATVRRHGGRWHVGFSVEVDRIDRVPSSPHTIVGVDLGVKVLAVLSTGESVPNPRHMFRAARRMRRLAKRCSRREGPSRQTRRPPSVRWQRARLHLARAHARVANLRCDGLHKLTTRLARTYGTIVVEDLHVAGLLRNRRLARHIADAGFAELRRQLSYKTVWNGGRIVVADRFYPSSKTCSGCGEVKTKLRLSERVFHCGLCGLHMDRDLNAARNLAAIVTRPHVAGSGPETENGRGADHKTRVHGQVAVKRQPGTASAGKTGTVPTQVGTSDQMRVQTS